MNQSAVTRDRVTYEYGSSRGSQVAGRDLAGVHGSMCWEVKTLDGSGGGQDTLAAGPAFNRLTKGREGAHWRDSKTMSFELGPELQTCHLFAV